ncbi:hypothetical protein SLA2020_447520 [Shorea laevis]
MFASSTRAPFISTLELRPLPIATYVSESGSLALFTRVDTGTVTNQTFRYKDDIFDRIWWPFSFSEWTTLSTSLTVKYSSQKDYNYEPPSVVMSTAATPANVDNSLDFNLNVPANDSGYYIYMYFAEVEQF